MVIKYLNNNVHTNIIIVIIKLNRILFSKSYFLNGNEYDAEEYNSIMQEREGLPWYKTSKGRAGENRN